ncbi:MAG: KTSC domain-containing protein [Candidatus Eremiobacteraeota bacterium]|nr:KTSC domain-containing protein [Candidatus Eremiobacteraeota bacterium]
MPRTPVESSTIAAIGYDPQANVLEIQFKPDRHGNAPVWRYENVAPDEYDTLTHAESIGRAFAVLIKPSHPGRKVAIMRLDGTTLEVLS